MKNTIVLITALLFINCKAQYTSIQSLEGRSSREFGVYYKDLNNFLNTFEGMYRYTNGATSFEIILQKKILSSANAYYYDDMLIGGYRYVENGVEKVNVLNDLNNNYPNGSQYKIYGNGIRTGKRLCPECEPNEKWLYGTIVDPVSHSVDNLYIRKTVVNGEPAIKIFILHELYARSSDAPPIPISYPLSQEIILIKQP